MGVQAIRTAEAGWHGPESMQSDIADTLPIAFGEFLALPASRTLLFRGVSVQIGSRAFDLLIVLLQSRGEIVSKEEIVRHVWPSTTVDESNLRIQMTNLRKVLGEARNRIKTVPGRGYLFATGNDAEVAAQPKRVMLWPAGCDPDALRKGARPAIVIIDEDPGNRAALHRLLRPFDANVESFVSVAAFLESRTAAPDLQDA